MKHQQFDAVIIGFGKGGKTLAAKLAQSGRTVALAEQDALMYGGTCINVGCIPSKSLILSAAQVDPTAPEEVRQAAFQAAIGEKRRLTAMLRQRNFEKLDQMENVTVFTGRARFTGPLQVEVATEGETLLLEAGEVFLNTGSTPRIPAIPGLDNIPGVYTSTGLMDLENLPRRLTVIGGGYVGLEFASMFAQFGSAVTVIQDSGTFLPKEDPDVAAEIRAQLEGQGIAIWLNARCLRAETGESGPVLTVEQEGRTERLASDAVLVAAGRVPNAAGLNCPAGGVALTGRGAIQVDELLRTTAPNVWAMGDVAGGLQHTYVSLDDSRILWDQLSGSGGRTTALRRNVPYSVFLRTPYSRVGLSETEARAAGRDVRVLKLSTAAVPKAQVLRETQGFLKAVVDAGSGKILGAMLLCPESYETINVVKLAMDLDANYTMLRDQIFTHPTMTEALNDLFAL